MLNFDFNEKAYKSKMGALLLIDYIFSENLFIRIPQGVCF